MRIALVGNPNVGKSSLFNIITKNNIKVGNWPGVTVKKEIGYYKDFEFFDLPGLYTLSKTDEKSIDEQVTLDFLSDSHNYDVIFNVIDASNLERNLYLTLELLEFNKPIIVVLTKRDVAEEYGIKLDIEKLKSLIKIDFFSFNPRKEDDIKPLLKNLKNVYPLEKNFSIYKPIEKEIQDIKTLLENQNISAIRFLENPSFSQDPIVLKIREDLAEKIGEDLSFYIAALRYEYICQVIHEAKIYNPQTKSNNNEKIDKIVMNKYLFAPIFLLVMYFIFTFSIYTASLLQDYFEYIADQLFIKLPRFFLEDRGFFSFLIIDGVGGGIAAVFPFIPVIFSLYFILSVIEDSGYMARAAFVINRFMSFIGLSGKAFVPLMISFGCNVPGILATRTLSKKEDRITVAMMAPFMSCGARLSIYVLFASAFFQNGAHNVVFILYLIGILIAILTGFLVNKLFKKKNTSEFIIELPSYQVPSINLVLKNAWRNTKGFLWGAGKLIVIGFVFLQTLNSISPHFKILREHEKDHSILSVVSRKITPAFHCIGVEKENWPAVIGIMTGVFAKEVVIGTMNALYKDCSEKTLQKHFKTKAQAFSYLLFILLYFPCISVFAVIASEIGLKWAIVSSVWSTSLAYIIASLFYQISCMVS